MFFVLLLLQRDHSNRMPCSYRKVVYSITFTMHRDAGHSLDGIKLVRLPVKTVACKCVALLCCYHAAFHYSRALNSYAVQSISKVSFLFCFAFCVPFRWVGRWINKTWAGHNFFSSTIHRWVIDFSTFRGSNSKKKTEIPSSVWQSHFGMRARITHVDVNLLLPGQNTITHRTFRCTAWKGRKNRHEGKQRKKLNLFINLSNAFFCANEIYCDENMRAWVPLVSDTRPFTSHNDTLSHRPGKWRIIHLAMILENWAWALKSRRKSVEFPKWTRWMYAENTDTGLNSSY